MRQDARRIPAEMAELGTKEFRRFLTYLGGILGLGAAGFLAMLLALNLMGSLPPPPITATDCIDEKLKYLAEQDLKGVDLLAVGSSVTWRNLDLRPFVARRLAERPINAAPCYLFMDQAVFLTRFLLDHMPQVKTVISVVSTRDFNYCAEQDRAFFDRDRAAAYVFDGGSPLPIYATNFRPLPFVRSALTVAEQRSGPDVPRSLFMGPYGAGPVTGNSPWMPGADFDDACFAALESFERMLSERGVQLILVTFPLSPAWRAEHDPQGDVLREFEQRLRESLRAHDTVFISGESLAIDRTDYYDAIHFRWEAAQRFSAALADRLLSEKEFVRASGGMPMMDRDR